MNKTWSVILIVIACLVVLGGTYWYFGMQKPNPQQAPTTSVAVEPLQAKVAKAGAGSASTPKTDPPLPEEKVVEEDQSEELAPEKSKQNKQVIAPVMTKDGGFGLPSFGVQAEDEETKGPLPPIEEPVVQEEMTPESIQPIPSGEESPPLAQDEEILVESEEEKEKTEEPLPPIEEPLVQEEQNPEGTQPMPSDDSKLPPVAEELVLANPENEQSLPIVNEEMPPVGEILATEKDEGEEKMTENKPALEASLSVSFLDYAFPRNLATSEKSFTVSVDVMSQKEVFGWGGTLEVGRMETSGGVQISLLGKATWKLGRGVVTYPLSISLGPTLFIDSTADTTEFGMKGKLSAGVTYAISDSFRIFYAVGVGATYNFPGSPSFHFVMEPIRVGVGFSF